jgi:nicotinate-nucleotide adenylyltransferase
MKIAGYGLAANPPHRGHKMIIEHLADRYDLVLMIPSAAHAFGKDLPPMAIRLPLCAALLSEVAADNVELSTLEEDLAGNGPVYSYDVLCAIKKRYPDAQIDLVIGPDNAAPEVWSRFYRADDIKREFGVYVAPDMGADKRSTRLRAMLREGASIEEIATVTTAAVAQLLINMDCYRSNASVS